MFSSAQRRYVESARVGRLATADAEGRPSAVPVCFAFADDRPVSPIDEKPQDNPPEDLRRVRDIAANPHVALIVDHYTETWSRLGWVRVLGTAETLDPDEEGHATGTSALRDKYDQYADHDLEDRPLVRIDPGSVQSWGRLERRPETD